MIGFIENLLFTLIIVCVVVSASKLIPIMVDGYINNNFNEALDSKSNNLIGNTTGSSKEAYDSFMNRKPIDCEIDIKMILPMVNITPLSPCF